MSVCYTANVELKLKDRSCDTKAQFNAKIRLEQPMLFEDDSMQWYYANTSFYINKDGTPVLTLEDYDIYNLDGIKEYVNYFKDIILDGSCIYCTCDGDPFKLTFQDGMWYKQEGYIAYKEEKTLFWSDIEF